MLFVFPRCYCSFQSTSPRRSGGKVDAFQNNFAGIGVSIHFPPPKRREGCGKIEVGREAVRVSIHFPPPKRREEKWESVTAGRNGFNPLPPAEAEGS